MRIIVVDDEPLARARLIRLLTQMPEHQCIAEANDSSQALKLINQLQPDLVLLDIAMPGKDGVCLGAEISQLPIPPAIIFVTAHPQHALDAYKASPVDYLLKPISEAVLGQALKKVGALTRAHFELNNNDPLISYQLGNQQKQTKLSDVYYFASDQKYTNMVFVNGHALLDLSLTQLEQQYPKMLLRIHRNCLVNRKWFKSLMTMPGGRHYIVLEGLTEKLEVSRRALPTVKLHLGLD